MPDIVVLREDVHGMPIDEYAAAIRERLPDHEVVVARTPAEERDLVPQAPIVTGLHLRDELLSEAANLRLFSCLYAGYDHLPLATLRARNVAVTTASGVHAPNMSEHVVGAILAFARAFPTAWRQGERREWRHLESRELTEATVTVVGLGAIGRATVDALSGFDVHTIGIRRSPERGGPADEVLGPESLHDALARTDYLVLACPLTEETDGLIGSAEFATLPPGAVLVNVARGPVVDTDALVTALQRESIRGAHLDVTDPEPLPADHPLWGLDNVFITPHSAGYSPAYYTRRAEILAANVRQAAESGAYEDLRNQI
jgi:phosphoglycerate dehydrogenase-like enzyme